MIDLNREQTKALRKLMVKVKFDTLAVGEADSGNPVVCLGNAMGRICVEMKDTGHTAKTWAEKL